MNEHVDMGDGIVVTLGETGSMWHWSIEGLCHSGAADTRDAALFWAGWWYCRDQSRAEVQTALAGGLAKATDQGTPP